jgi:hypothetical protein
MDSILYFILGAFIVTLTSYDLIFTTFSPRGSGILSSTVTTVVWRAFGLLCKLTGRRSFLNGAGILIVSILLIMWVVLLWTGNVLIFMSDKESVVNSTTNLPADTLQRVYYTGYVLSTMGNGDFKGGTDLWLIYSSFISFSGLILITIAISYMVPVLSAITQRRALSIRIASIGNNSQQMLLNSWNGKSFKRLKFQLNGLEKNIAEQGQLHLAYPVLHYFQHSDKNVALIPNLAALDEALTMLLLYVPEQHHPGYQYIIPVRKSITTFLQTLNTLFINPEGSEVPPLDLSELIKAGIPLKQPTLEDLSSLNHRRKMVKAMVDNDGWRWEDIGKPAFSKDMDLPSMH